MDLYQMKEVFEKIKGGAVELQFDDSCLAKAEINFVEGKMAEEHILEYNNILIKDSEGTTTKVKISSHRQPCTKEKIKDILK